MRLLLVQLGAGDSHWPTAAPGQDSSGCGCAIHLVIAQWQIRCGGAARARPADYELAPPVPPRRPAAPRCPQRPPRRRATARKLKAAGKLGGRGRRCNRRDPGPEPACKEANLMSESRRPASTTGMGADWVQAAEPQAVARPMRALRCGCRYWRRVGAAAVSKEGPTFSRAD